VTEVEGKRLHIANHLGVGADPRGEGAARIHCPPDVCGSTGVPHLGVLALLVDTLGGVLASLAVEPDIVVTTDLTIVRDPTLRPRSVTGIGEVVRRGRSSVTMEMPLVDDEGHPVGWGVMSSAVLPGGEQSGRAGRLFERPGYETEAGVVRPPIHEVVGIEPADGPDDRVGCQVEIRRDLANSLGILHGGVLAMLMDATAIRSARASGLVPGLAADLVTEEMTIRYIAANRVGPIRVTASVLAASAHAVTSRLEARDLGSGRLTGLATARVAPTS